jgi:outer membrane receptor protein involved in Fe transport
MPVDSTPQAPAPPPPVAAVVVQAARLPPAPGDAAFSILTISPAALQSSDRLDEALATAPGFSLFRRTSSLAANPTTQGVSLRGFAPSGASRSLVTLDGVPQNDPFGGWVIWTALPSEDLDGAELVRGAGAGPYGAGALTGVVSLTEHGAQPAMAFDADGGEPGYGHAAAMVDANAGPVNLLAVASGEHSDGWVPEIEGRGPADDRLSLTDWNVAARAQAALGAGVLAVRAGAYDEARHAGLVGAQSNARGEFASATWAAAPEPGGFGWRLQGWVRGSNLANTSVSVSPGQLVATPANNEYATPALGYGFNGALRRAWTGADLEVGVDVRAATADDHELFSYNAGQHAFLKNREAGGRTVVAGAYLEADRTWGGWLFDAGARGDYWGSADGHLFERLISTGAVTLGQQYPARSGVVPTGRVGAKRDLGHGVYLRAAAYAGFRAPTLNELYRPFRVGNNTTNANPALRPERLEGVEAGVGGADAAGAWSLTAFANRLSDAVTNVTLSSSPAGTVFQRQNAGVISAAGLEGEAERHVTDTVELTAAFDWTWSRVNGGTAAPQLTGLRPAQAPRLVLTGGADWRPIPRLTLRAEAHYESRRFDDDRNTVTLRPGATLDLQARWRLDHGDEVYVAVDNVADAHIPTAQASDGTYSYDAPRLVRVGLSVRR